MKKTTAWLTYGGLLTGACLFMGGPGVAARPVNNPAGALPSSQRPVATASGAKPVVDSATKSGAGSRTTGKPSPVLPAVPSQAGIDLKSLPADMVICTAGKHPLTVGQYRCLFKMEQLEMQNALIRDPQVRAHLLAEANKRGLSLSPQEKDRLLQVAQKGQGSAQQFQQFLKEQRISQAQFNQEIWAIGLAIKASKSMLEQSLLNDLINRDLLASAARKANLTAAASRFCQQVKRSPSYRQLLANSGLTPEQLQQELMQTQLAKLMLERIQKQTRVSDQEILAYYKQNQAQFKHQERIRLSQILIGAPLKDSNGVQSLTTQVLKAHPHLSGKELQQAVSSAQLQQQQKARQLLAQAQSPGQDFTQLANNNTDDVAARAAHQGGDIGWHERSQLIPEFARAVWPLKTNQVYSQLIRTPLGFHIVKVTGHQGPGQVPLSEIRPLLSRAIGQKLADQAVERWLVQERKQTPITLAPKFAALLKTKTN